MRYEDSHLSDEQILQDVDGELPAQRSKQIRSHLDACWKCRTRRSELENAIADFVRGYQRSFDAKLPPAAGPRASLKAHLANLSDHAPSRQRDWLRSLRKPVWEIALTTLLLLGLFLSGVNRYGQSSQRVIVSMPDSRLTPGAALLTSRQAVCSTQNVNNKDVPMVLRKKVLAEYGLQNAELRAYEVDYLVTPGLGGADDIRNLWPHSYLKTQWNAHVKDALESRLRDMVCDGTLDLTEAQLEISSNWIAAYKKYFHTDRPLNSR